jgi:hypothetical protein
MSRGGGGLRRRGAVCGRVAAGAARPAAATPNSPAARLERRAVREPILQREHDQTRSGTGCVPLEVNRLRVEQPRSRDDEQAAAHDARALLVPQRELARQLAP